jgi:hypothetical protein
MTDFFWQNSFYHEPVTTTITSDTSLVKICQITITISIQTLLEFYSQMKKRKGCWFITAWNWQSLFNYTVWCRYHDGKITTTWRLSNVAPRQGCHSHIQTANEVNTISTLPQQEMELTFLSTGMLLWISVGDNTSLYTWFGNRFVTRT